MHRVEQLAIVAKLPGLWEVLECFAGPLLVHVARCNDVLTADLLQVLVPLAAAADDGEVQTLVWSERSCG
jgi:hypothetical protein